MNRALFTVSWVCCFASSALAMTGAELMQTDDQFAQGYILGVVEDEAFVGEARTLEAAQRLKCIIAAKASASNLTDAVRAYITDHPKQLAISAVSSVIIIVNDMCPANSNSN